MGLPLSSTMARSTILQWRIALLYVSFFLSGFSALIYQTAWQRMLGLFAGSDAVAITLVVGAFLFGLGVGSLWSGSFSDRLSHRHALIAFGLCELGIGLLAITSRFVFYDFVFGRLNGLAHSPTLVGLVVFVCLLPPTILMGMSLPLLSKAVVYRIELASSEISWLYGINTFGASFGTLCAGFYLIGTFGYEITVYLAAFLNFLVFAGALIVASFLTEDNAEQPSVGTIAAARSSARRRIWLWSLIVFVSGFLIISLEIVWFRVLGTLMQTNAYAFPLILACFLFSDAGGIIYGARVAQRTDRPLRLFQWLQGVMALYAIMSLWALSLAVDWGLSRWLTDGMFAYISGLYQFKHLLLYVGITTLCVFPPAFLLGMSFPITQRAVQDDPDLVGHRVGQIQLFNIFGNTCGAIVTGLVLLESIGTSGTIRLVGLAGLIFLLALYVQLLRDGKRIPLGHAIFGGVLVVAIPAFPDNAVFWSRLHGSETQTIVGEDRTGVVVLRHLARSQVHYGDPIDSDADLLYVSGYAESRVPFLLVHGALGMVGGLIHPNPRSILLIGYGSGGSPYGAGVNPRTERIRVVELVHPEFSVMERFSSTSPYSALKRLLADRRIERIVGDGRHFLYTNKSRYDIVQADAVTPWLSHSGLLYSVEFFRQVRAHLEKSGLYVQWIPKERTLETFLSVFPYVLQLNDVAIGSDQPIPYSEKDLKARLHSPEVRRYLDAANWDPDEILSRLTRKSPRVWGPADRRMDFDVNTDLFPKDEYFLNRRKFSYIDPSTTHHASP